ncbi:hypothetical protein [uncultured Halomonas sp.]|uniref:hypothetical protein n=1 Tax=uncultured Halomonas sp. TaxID=173971 RepID=UPI002618CA53|nr:hypothetical protein [uncultured Halomonas sp.]
MVDQSHFRPVIRHLEKVGGCEIIVTKQGIYEVTARKLDIGIVREAIKNLTEEKSDAPDAE